MNSKAQANDLSAIRVLHHMARSGGTVISKCLATMDNVVLLSEIHPVSANMFNPLQQAHEWYGLFNEQDIQRLQHGKTNFVEGILLIHERCVGQGKTLVLRDWTHLDFIGVPFIPNPSYRLSLVDILKQKRSVINTATVRHPVTQWLSTSRLAVMQEKITLDLFLSGYRKFAEHCVDIGFIRYEDFTREPEHELTTLCERLDIKYDDGWRDRWWSYDKITGDSSGKNTKEIKQPSYKKLDSSLLKAFARNKDYQRSLELLGYEHL